MFKSNRRIDSSKDTQYNDAWIVLAIILTVVGIVLNNALGLLIRRHKDPFLKMSQQSQTNGLHSWIWRKKSTIRLGWSSVLSLRENS